MGGDELNQWLLVATVVGPFVGAAAGWVLTETLSTRLQNRRAREAARFEVVRGLMRSRTTAEMSVFVNEVPLFFGDNENVMRLWRDLALGRSPDRENVLTALVIAAVRDVGISHLEESDFKNYVRYDPSGFAE